MNQEEERALMASIAWVGEDRILMYNFREIKTEQRRQRLAAAIDSHLSSSSWNEVKIFLPKNEGCLLSSETKEWLLASIVGNRHLNKIEVILSDRHRGDDGTLASIVHAAAQHGRIEHFTVFGWHNTSTMPRLFPVGTTGYPFCEKLFWKGVTPSFDTRQISDMMKHRNNRLYSLHLDGDLNQCLTPILETLEKQGDASTLTELHLLYRTPSLGFDLVAAKLPNLKCLTDLTLTDLTILLHNSQSGMTTQQEKVMADNLGKNFSLRNVHINRHYSTNLQSVITFVENRNRNLVGEMDGIFETNEAFYENVVVNPLYEAAANDVNKRLHDLSYFYLLLLKNADKVACFSIG